MRKLFILLVAGILAFVLMPNLMAQADDDDPKCYDTVVVKAAWTEVIEHPAVTHDETTTVTDEPAWDETVIDQKAVPAQHYAHAHNAGAGLGADEIPPTPAQDPDQWQANTTQEPHDNGNGDPVTWYPTDPATSGLHYASHGSSGHRDWFYFQPAVAAVTHVVHHPAVTHDETVTVTDKAAWTETIQHPAVTAQVEVPCDTDEPPVVPPVDEEPPVVDEPPVHGPKTPVVGPKEHHKPRAPKPAAEPVAIPTAVDAGM